MERTHTTVSPRLPESTASAVAPHTTAPQPRYGLQAGGRPAIAELANAVERAIDAYPGTDIPERIAALLSDRMGNGDLLAPHQRQADISIYRRHILFADPGSRFTIMAYVWLPGQGTPVHAHTAWGAVGVYKGSPSVINYDCWDQGNCVLEFGQRSKISTERGDVCWVKPGLEDIHRVFNDSDRPVITIHVYGRDLLRNPRSININLDLDT